MKSNIIKYIAIAMLSIAFTQVVSANDKIPTLDKDSAYQLQETTVESENTITTHGVSTNTKKEYYIDKDGVAKTIDYKVKTASPKHYELQLKDDSEKTKYTNQIVAPIRIDGGQFVGNTSGKDIIKNINKDFINNTVNVKVGISGSGLVGNLNTKDPEMRIENITADFINNTINAQNLYGGGLIGNYGYGSGVNTNTAIDKIQGNFIGNKIVISTYFYAGGLIGNYGSAYKNADVNTSIGSITANFYNNEITFTGSNGNYNNLFGGGIIGNIASTYGGSTNSISSIGNISGNFVNNKVISNSNIYGGGLIGNYASTNSSGASATAKIDKIEGSFIKNVIKSDKNILGGLIGNYGSYANYRATMIKQINADFCNNHVESTSTDSTSYKVQGGAIANMGASANINKISSNFVENGAITNSTSTSASAQGGAIYNSGQITDGIVNSNFIGNYAKGNVAQGGAIYSSRDITVIADKSTSIFSGNYVQNSSGKEDNAIYMNNADLTLETKNKGSIIMKDSINGENYNVNITGDGSGTFYMYNDIKNANVTFSNTNISTVDHQIHDYTFNSFAIVGKTNMYVDADLAAKTMDRIVSSTYSGDGKLNIAGINILSDSVDTSTQIKFADSGFAGNVTSGVTTAFSPIYKYTVSYVIDSKDGVGYFKFERGNGKPSSNPDITVVSIPGVISKSKMEFYTNKNGKAAFTNYSIKTADTKYYDDIKNSTTATSEYSNVKVSPSSLYGSGVIGNKSDTAVENRVSTAEGNFMDNTITAKYNLYGSGIIGNYATASSLEKNDQLVIEKINGEFINNKVTGNSIGGGGLIGNFSYANTTAENKVDTEIQNIKGNFIGNVVTSKNNLYGGGLIGNYGSIETTSTNASAKIGVINADFYNNQVYHSTSSSATYYMMGGGGLIGNYASNKSEVHSLNTEISSISGTFANNTMRSGLEIRGGGIIGNYANSKGGNTTASIGEIKGSFIKNTVSTKQSVNGGVIGNNVSGSKTSVAMIKQINADFYNNHVESTNSSLAYGRVQGGAISNFVQLQTNQTMEDAGKAVIGKISGNFVENGVISASTKDTTLAKGGAIYNNGEITDGIINSNFIGNYAKSPLEKGAMGGAIYSDTNLKIVSEKGTSVFSGNYTESAGIKEDNAIYMNNADLTLETKNKGSIIMKDSINGENYNVNITGDGSGTFYMYNDIKNANVTFGKTNISTVNNEIHEYNFNTLTLGGTTKLYADVDLVNKEIDRIKAGSYGEHNGKLNVAGLNIISDSKEIKTKLLFADNGLSNNISVTKTAYSPIYKYGVRYEIDKETQDGYINFTRAGIVSSSSSGGNSYNMYNPAVLATPAAALTGLYTAQLHTFNYAFRHSDITMNNPLQARKLDKMEGRYAMANDGAGIFSPLVTKSETAGFWIRPYATFENVPLKHGPKINSISYGTLIGFDEPLKELKYGWDRVLTYYIGYNGANQSFSSVDSYQNGGLIGSTITLYKNNFFNATTISVGASVGENSTMYGSETFSALMAGIGNKMGYNVELFDGRFIIQPSMLVSYTFLNAFDYTNAANVRIDSDPMSIIQLAPTFKFIGNTKKGWQPYLAVGMVWNIMAHSQVFANDVELPNMYIKPYVQYGIGVQKTIKDRFTAFGQAMIFNGGRNGVSLTTGIRWMLGK